MQGDVFTGGSRTGELMRALDWSRTPVGPVEGWPASLRSGVRTVLSSRYPMLLLWGPEFTQLYNDAYSALIGDRHPAALGGDVRVTLAEGWPVLGPIIDETLRTGVASWVPSLQLLLIRSGYREESYFSVSHAVYRDDEGVVRGILAVCSEVTEQVLAERRLRLLRDLSVPVDASTTVHGTARALVDVVAGHGLDVPFAALYLRDGAVLRRVAVTSQGPGGPAAALPGELALDGDDPWGLGAAARTGRVTAVHDPAGLAAARGGAWNDPVTDALALPLASTDPQRRLGVLLAAVSPARELDDAYRSFFDLLAQQAGVALRTATAYAEERARAEALAELDRVKTSFFTNVSHEFRTPLTLMTGPLADALADPSNPLPAPQRERVETARRNATRLLKLVNNLLTFSSVEAGTAAPAAEPVDLAVLTADLASGFRSAVERAGLELVVDCPPLPRPVAVDPEHWEKVVTNLLSNALKFTFVGRITVRLREDGDAVRLTVADTGIGIAEGDLPRLFERFHRVQGARSRSHEGSGIGLALVRELTLLHGGDVSVASEPGVGTTFTVVLPWPAVAPAPQGGADADGRAAARPGTGTLDAAVEEVDSWLSGPAPSASRPDAPAGRGEEATTGDAVRVLVADDNGDMRAYLSRLLREQGWEVEAVPDGAAALESALCRPPDLLLTDVMMPELDGFELVRALRAHPLTETLPIIVVSARAGQEAGVEGLELGADDYVTKPFVPADLVARARTTVQLARLRRRHLGQLAMLTDAAARMTDLVSPGPADRLEEGVRTIAEQARALLDGRCAVVTLDARDGRLPVHVTQPPVPEGVSATDRAVRVEVRGRQGRLLGTLAVHLRPGRTAPPDARALLRPVAQMIAALAEGTWHFRREHDVAATLQRGLLPEHLPEVPGLRLASRYLPAAGAGMLVGGDWYDALELPGGCVALSVGDVAGHGLDAAVVMGQLRSAVRAHCLAGLAPGEVVARLDAQVAAMTGDVLATLLLVRLDPATGALEWCSAGHPPAVHVRAGGAAWLDADGEVDPVEPPLGAGVPRAMRDHAATLGAGELLLLYTDGLVEDRADQLDVGPVRLLRTVGRAAVPGDGDGRSLAEGLLAQVVAGVDRAHPDDVAVLAVLREAAVPAAGADPVAGSARALDVHLAYPARLEAAGRMRRDVRTALGGAGVPAEIVDDVLIAASEALNNALEHAQDPRRPQVEVHLGVAADTLTVRVRDHGTWRARRPSMDRGHGSSLMTALADVRIEPGPGGTTVTMTWRLRGPVRAS